MDVIIICDYDPQFGKKGGIGTHLKFFFDYLLQLKKKKLKWGIMSYLGFFIPDENKKIILKEKFNIKKLKVFSSQKHFLRIIKKYKPKLIHVHRTSMLSPRLIHNIRSMNIKLLLSVHGIAAEEKKYWPIFKQYSFGSLYRYREKRSLQHSDWIIVDTNYVLNNLRKHYNIKGNNVSSIALGIGNEWFNIQRKLEENRFLSVGGIERRKGYHTVLEAARLLKVKNKNYKWIICGRIRDKGFFEELEENRIKYNLKDNLEFKLNISDKELKQEYKKASLFILPSLEESQGIVFVEAMAVGIPIIATNIGGIPFVVKNKRNGILVNVNDPQQLSNAIIKLINNQSLMTEFRNNNIKDANNYRVNITNEKILKIYEKLIN